jgi:nicotinamide phosphoribosyltransferase
MKKGFAVSNCVFGIGSYTYQYNTRDTFGFALKATHAVIEGEERFIFKAPKTDTDNFKKSQKGMCYVFRVGEDILYKDELTIKEQAECRDNLLEVVFKDGELVKEFSLSEIRDRLHGDF